MQTIFYVFLNLAILSDQNMADWVKQLFTNFDHLSEVFLDYGWALTQSVYTTKVLTHIFGPLNHL
jgi:hypothetical protein